MTSLDQTSSGDCSVDPSLAATGGGPRAEVEAETTSNLLAGLGNRLRSAYEDGADLAELAAACRQPLETVHRLLKEAGADLPAERLPPPTGVVESRQLRRLRRPSPSRRLRRIHDAPPADEAVKSDRTPAEEEAVPDTRSEPESVEAGAPLGILIGATPGHARQGTQLRAGPSRRVAARLVRVGRGTSLVVLPDWRSAIAVSVPTDQLVASTGLRFAELAAARLSVVINPGALHDRELSPQDWRAERKTR